MTLWSIVLLASGLTLAEKFAGYAVPRRLLDGPIARSIADLVTVSLLAALTAVQGFSLGQTVVVDARLYAIGAAAGLLFLRAPFLLVVVVAALTATGARWIGFAS